MATNSNNGHPIRYGDGVAVDEQNQAEAPPFLDYERQAQTVSPSRAALQAANIQVSMDGRGRFLDNIFVERLWRTRPCPF